jgi:hypothetical protein
LILSLKIRDPLQLLQGSKSAGDHRGVDLISDVLPFGRLWYAELSAISNA